MARARQREVAAAAPTEPTVLGSERRPTLAGLATEPESDAATALGKAMESVTSFIPTEAVTVYIAGLGLFAPSSPREKWIVFTCGLAVVTALVLLNAPASAFKSRLGVWRPAVVLLISVASFVAWAAAAPGGPFGEISARATIWGGFAVLVTAPVLPLLAKRFGITT